MRNPLRIQLKDLPKQGEEFVFTNKTGELNQALKDLFGENSYEIQVKLTPSGPFFKIEGTLVGEMNLNCARCAWGFKYKINKSFSESLMVNPQPARIDKQMKMTVSSEEKDFCTELSSYSFSFGDFLHELIAVEEPLRPLGKPDCDEHDNCEHLNPLKKFLKT